MIAFDNNSGGTVNLLPIYNSLSFQQSEIEELSNRPAGDVINTNSTYNFNATTSETGVSIGFDNLKITGPFVLENSYSLRASENKSFNIDLRNNSGLLSYVRLYGNGYTHTGHLNFQGINFKSNTFNSFSEATFKFSDAETFYNNSFADNSEGLFDLEKFRYVSYNTISKMSNVSFNEIVNLKNNRFYNITGFEAKNVSGFNSQSMNTVSSIYVNNVDSAQYNGIRNDIKEFNLCNIGVLSTNYFNNCSVGKIDLVQAMFSNSCYEIKKLTVSNCASLSYNTLECNDLYLDGRILGNNTIKADVVNLDMGRNDVLISGNLLFDKDAQTINVNNNLIEWNVLKNLNDSTYSNHIYNLNHLPNKELNPSFNPSLINLDLNMYDKGYSTDQFWIDAYNTASGYKITETEKIYDENLNFIPTEYDENKICVRDINLIPYLRNLANANGYVPIIKNIDYYTPNSTMYGNGWFLNNDRYGGYSSDTFKPFPDFGKPFIWNIRGCCCYDNALHQGYYLHMVELATPCVEAGACNMCQENGMLLEKINYDLTSIWQTSNGKYTFITYPSMKMENSAFIAMGTSQQSQAFIPQALPNGLTFSITYPRFSSFSTASFDFYANDWNSKTLSYNSKQTVYFKSFTAPL